MVIPGPNYQAQAFLNNQYAAYGQLRQQSSLIAQQNQILQQQAYAEQAHYNRMENEAATRRELLRFLHEIGKYTDELLSLDLITVEQFLYFATKHNELMNRDFSLLDNIESLELHSSVSQKMASAVYLLRSRIDMGQKIQYYQMLTLLEELPIEEEKFDEQLAQISSRLEPELALKKTIDNIGYLKRQLKVSKENRSKYKKTSSMTKELGILGYLLIIVGISCILFVPVGIVMIVPAVLLPIFGYTIASMPKNAKHKYQAVKATIKSLKSDISQAENAQDSVEWIVEHLKSLQQEVAIKKEAYRNDVITQATAISERLNVLDYPLIQISRL